jgi:hypothetical protein
MPWTAKDAAKHTKRATTDKLKRQWASVANDARKRCIADGGDEAECDASAIRQANAAMTEADVPVGGPDKCVCPECGYAVDKERGVPCRSVECPECGAALVAKEDDVSEIKEALTKSVSGHNLKGSDFLVVEDPEKTTTWHLPVKVNGKADRKLAAAAWAALFSAGGHRGQKYSGPNKAESKRKLKALYKAEGWDEPASEAEAQAQANLCEADLAELYGDAAVDYTWMPAVSFADLDAQREAREKAQTLREMTTDLQMLIDNIMWSSEVTDKVSALRGVFDEYLRGVEEQVGGSMPSEETETVEESAPVDLSEQAAMLSVAEASIDDLAQFDSELAEQHVELSDPRRAPVLVDFAIIQPGHGNKVDKRYYPAEMLERDGGLFEGVDVYVTNHDPDEKTERNKVGRFKSVRGLTEQGLVGTAILYDPDVAEKARNRADAGELDTLHCSIFASGTGKTGQVDGEEVTVIESITKVHSVDLVSRAGAGGHAIALTESEGIMDPKQDELEQPAEEQEIEEAQPEVVEIRESEDAGEEPPASLSAESVTAILAESELDAKARKWLEGREYRDEAEVKAAVAEMEAFIAEIAPHAGEPFALGETAAPVADVPKVLSPEELEERAKERTRRILSEVLPSYAANL